MSISELGGVSQDSFAALEDLQEFDEGDSTSVNNRGEITQKWPLEIPRADEEKTGLPFSRPLIQSAKETPQEEREVELEDQVASYQRDSDSFKEVGAEPRESATKASAEGPPRWKCRCILWKVILGAVLLSLVPFLLSGANPVERILEWVESLRREPTTTMPPTTEDPRPMAIETLRKCINRSNDEIAPTWDFIWIYEHSSWSDCDEHYVEMHLEFKGFSQKHCKWTFRNNRYYFCVFQILNPDMVGELRFWKFKCIADYQLFSINFTLQATGTFTFSELHVGDLAFRHCVWTGKEKGVLKTSEKLRPIMSGYMSTFLQRNFAPLFAKCVSR